MTQVHKLAEWVKCVILSPVIPDGSRLEPVVAANADREVRSVTAALYAGNTIVRLHPGPTGRGNHLSMSARCGGMVFVGLLLGLIAAAQPAASGPSLQPQPASTSAPALRNERPAALTPSSAVYLPLAVGGGSLLQDTPIWVDVSTPDESQVALFRHWFALDEDLEGAELAILADTRYEVWLDGSWLGRGPARFSLTRREYDLYPLDSLPAGDHLIAALVQWAPNVRRSESLTPFLLAHIQGRGSHGFDVVARTGPTWKALQSDAWQRGAALVHSWYLIGPTELLDLRQHPTDWMSLTFSDAEWPNAVGKNWSQEVPAVPSTPFLYLYDGFWPIRLGRATLQARSSSLDAAIYRPRSIAFPEAVPIPVQVIETGLLSPGRAMAELVPPLPEPLDFPFDAISPTTFTLEVLADAELSLPWQVRLDGEDLAWEEAGVDRPDVWVASTAIAVGPHLLSFPAVGADGLTFSLTRQDLMLGGLPFEQGLHAGRRLLLSEPVPQPGQVIASSGLGPEPLLEGIEFLIPASYAVLDLGRVVHGRLVAEITGPAGSVLDVGWAQRLWQGVRPLPYPGSLHPEWNQVDSWILDGGNRTIATIDARSGRYLLLAAWGDAPIRLESIRVLEERYPLVIRGAFSSSDDLLDRIWRVGVDTVYPNMTDAYTDTPWRERGQWWGDAFVEDKINEVVFGDTKLLRRGLLFMADAFEDGRPEAMAPNGDGAHMLDFGMLWVQGLQRFWQRTADDRFLRDLYPVVRDFMTYLQLRQNAATGLLDLPRDHWSVTVLIDWAGSDSRYGQSTALNAVYYGTLLDAAVIADRVGDQSQAAAWRERADEVRQQANVLLFLPAEHQYLTTIYDGQRLPPSPHAQAWALAYGLVPEAEADEVASALLALLSSDPATPNLESYGMYWTLKALGAAGRVPEALQIIERYYGRMLDLGASTWWERFLSDRYYTSSLCHGWSGAPTWFLSTYVLGALEPEAGKWFVKPGFGALEQASGVLPLQTGELQLAWSTPRCEEATLTVTSPLSTTGEVVLPLAGATTVVTMNDALIWSYGMPLVEAIWEERDGVHIELDVGGSYRLQARRTCATLFLPTISRR